MSFWTALFVLILALLLGRFVTLPLLSLNATRALSSRWSPLFAGAATAVFMGWLWGGLDQVAVIHDEAAYLLQAKLYASGHWTAPGRPLPEFFEQYHVLVTPRLTPKYFPGHAMMLVPGVWLGLPGLMPVLLLGVCGSLVFELSRRLTNPWIGLLAWLFWTTAPGVVEALTSYLSETTTSACWMLGWFALWKWTENDRQRWLVVLAIAIGIGFLSRPLTMLVFSLTAGTLVILRVGRRRTWSELVPPSAVGFIFVGIWLLWCQRTTGSALHTPWELYRQLYIPDDTFGFGLTGKHPLRTLNPDMAAFNQWVMTVHQEHTLASLPLHLAQRISVIAANMFATRALLLAIATFAMLTLGTTLRFASATAMLLVLAYLSYAHLPEWSVYYIEIQPVLAFATAVGWWQIAGLVAIRSPEWPVRSLPQVTPNVVLAVIVSTVLLLPYTMEFVPYAATEIRKRQEYHREFRDLLERTPGTHIMVFIRYAADHSPHRSLVTNSPDLAAARVWTVYDRGSQNSQLIKLYPRRTPFLFDEGHRLLIPLDSTGTPHPDRAIMER